MSNPSTLRVASEALRKQGNQIAKTILDQMGGLRRIQAMTGAKDFLHGTNWVSFKFPNKQRSKPNYVKITLDASDTYTVEFGRIVGYDLKNTKSTSMVYADQLVELFERTTGLYLRL